MPPTLALIFCVGLIIVLLFNERKQNPTASYALWIPTIWMLICGSRPLGRWFEPTAKNIEEGSPLDRWVLSILIFLALLVLYKRKIAWSLIIKNNFSLIFLCIFTGFSILWSDFPFLSFKRWIKLLGAIPIAMVVLSEKSPFGALESVFRRCAYVLIPFSLILIKYYPHLGRAYGRWSGLPMWIGVTSTKNGLAQLCAVSIFFFIWAFIRDRREKRFVKIRFRKITDRLILAIAIFLLAGIGGAYSATSISALVVGTVTLLILYKVKGVEGRISMFIVCATVLVWLFMTFSKSFVEVVAGILGRDETFTGRKDMWLMLINAAARHPLLGTGFGGYFGTPGNEFAEAQDGSVTGHNGLLNVLVEVGVVGLIILLGFHLSFYRKLLKGLKREFDWGVFGIAFLIMALLWNYTESLFLEPTSYIWGITIILSVIFSSPYLGKKVNNLPRVESVSESNSQLI
jgi:O-antigen ligase